MKKHNTFNSNTFSQKSFKMKHILTLIVVIGFASCNEKVQNPYYPVGKFENVDSPANNPYDDSLLIYKSESYYDRDTVFIHDTIYIKK